MTGCAAERAGNDKEGYYFSQRLATVDCRGLLNITRYVLRKLQYAGVDDKNVSRQSHRSAVSRIFVKTLPPTIQKRAREKLDLLHHARTLDDLRAAPGNHLEKLTGNRRGQLAIRINRQWRVCFDWQDGDAWNVEVTDYH